MTGNLHNPVMKMPISCSVKDNTIDAAVEREGPMLVVSYICLVMNGLYYRLYAEIRMSA